MMLAGNNGAEIQLPTDVNSHGWCFGENQSRYIIATKEFNEVVRRSTISSIPFMYLGKVIEAQELKISNGDIISLDELRELYESGLSKHL